MTVAQTSTRPARRRVARYRSADIGSTWLRGAALAVVGGGVVGAGAGAIVGFFTNAGLAGLLLGMLVGVVLGLLLGVLAALTIAPALAWFLHVPGLQGSAESRVLMVGRVLVVVLTIVGWTILTLITSEGVGSALGDFTFWWMLAVLVGFGWWGTGRVVTVSNVATRSTRRRTRAATNHDMSPRGGSRLNPQSASG
jgi:hypothetical protein